jgi:Tfp pilus assembly protein PilV
MSTRVRLRDETGLSLYEVLVAILVLVVGMMGVYVSIGTTNGAVAAGEKTAVIAQAAQQQLESVEALPYASIANSSDPQQTSTTDSSDPTYYLTSCVSGTCSSYYAGLSKSGTAEPIDLDATNGKVAPGPTKQVVADPNASTCASTNTSTCRIVVSVYTFITNVPPSEESACTNTSSCYKRITVAVKNTGQGPPRQPYYLSTFIGPKGGGGSGNPLTSSSTTCNDQGQVVVCTH